MPVGEDRALSGCAVDGAGASWLGPKRGKRSAPEYWSPIIQKSWMNQRSLFGARRTWLLILADDRAAALQGNAVFCHQLNRFRIDDVLLDQNPRGDGFDRVCIEHGNGGLNEDGA